MGATDRVIASMSPDDTAAALRLLKVLEECRQIDPTEAEAWRRRITGWARFNAVGAEAKPRARPPTPRHNEVNAGRSVTTQREFGFSDPKRRAWF